MNLKLLKLISYQLKKNLSSKYSFRMHSCHHWLFFYFNKNKSACKLNVLSLGGKWTCISTENNWKTEIKKTQVIEINMNFYKNFMKLNYSNDRQIQELCGFSFWFFFSQGRFLLTTLVRVSWLKLSVLPVTLSILTRINYDLWLAPKSFLYFTWFYLVSFI